MNSPGPLTSSVPLQTLSWNHSKDARRSGQPIYEQESRDADIAPSHVIPPRDVEEGIPSQAGIEAVDMAEIGAGDDEEVISRHLGSGEEATQNGQAGQE